ncbi:methylenetetrahydrofolate reductase [Mesorhizobium sp. L-8-3]|uniref:methylenetetrahydrofolate reductase n=1 Tax=Mesorhizobium sp. L-8-3 TaxID=2744522 RepID=UPI0019288264|nr:methylenetetrahydrofolate reductase [Mesorhizobium sp. L-8-3]BCH27755.1 methylenetetrahydrofolate reductase [Mesorhizobium sp. L-8-3]
MDTTSPLHKARPQFIGASTELAPGQAIDSPDLPGLFPQGVRVYITDIGTDDTPTLVRAARRVTDLGYTAVSHIACRRQTTRIALEERVRALAEEAGVGDVLIIGGDVKTPAGVFSSSMDVLETGFLDKYGIAEIGIAGHPEGSRDFSDEVANGALRLKQAWGERTGARLRIVTQFGFDAEKFIAWADGLAGLGIDLPVHLGVAGPAKITTLLKYAAVCGVGNSLSFFKKRSASLAALATSHSPESFVSPVEEHFRANPGSAIEQLHVFPFGGIKNASRWLHERGSWASEERPAARLEFRTH